MNLSLLPKKTQPLILASLIEGCEFYSNDLEEDAYEAIKAYTQYRQGDDTWALRILCSRVSHSGWDTPIDDYYGSYFADGSLTQLGIKVRVAAVEAQQRKG